MIKIIIMLRSNKSLEVIARSCFQDYGGICLSGLGLIGTGTRFMGQFQTGDLY